VPPRAEATIWYDSVKQNAISMSDDMDTMYAGEDTWGIGDQAYLSFWSKMATSGKSRVDTQVMVARHANAVVRVEYLRLVPATDFATAAEATEQERAFRDPALAVYKDVVEDLH
jgi:hypothetical protein